MKPSKISFISLGLIPVIALFIFLGCNQDESTLQPDKVAFTNPYDYVGEYHNEGLAQVLADVKEEYLASAKNNIDLEELVYNKTRAYCMANPIGGVAVTTEQFDQVIKPLGLSRKNAPAIDMEYIGEFMEILNDPTDCENVTDITEKIACVEAEIYESSLSDEDKEVLLIAYAVGKHSLEFWVSIVIDEETEEEIILYGGFGDWWKNKAMPYLSYMLEADFGGAAAGAIGGAIIGGAGGMIGGPAGGITGAITGAVVGGGGSAIVSSACAGAGYFIFNK